MKVATKVFAFTEQDIRGMAIRLDMLSTHYRKPKDFTFERLNASAKTIRRWLAIMVPSQKPVPVSVLEALCDDLNTVQAIAEMHKIAKTDPESLFTCMLLLGLVPGNPRTVDYDIVSGVKTIPIDHIPLVQWESFVGEFAVAGGPEQ